MGRTKRLLGAMVVGGVRLLAVASSASVSTATPTPSAIPEGQTTVVYEAYTFSPADRDVARRLAAGEDPRGIPGVTAVTSQDAEPAAPSTPENEAGLAEEAYEAGVTYETNAADLPER